jgi:hypothetical protein
MAAVYQAAPFAPFDDVTFPEDISYGSAGGPEYVTEIVTLGGGAEMATSRRPDAQERWNVAYGVRDETALDRVISFFMCRRGRAAGFWFVVPNTGETVRARFDTDHLPRRLEDLEAESAEIPIVQIKAWV